MINTDKIFHLKDNDNNEISNIIKYNIERSDVEFQFIIIACKRNT